MGRDRLEIGEFRFGAGGGNNVRAPAGASRSPDDFVYVADTGNDRIQRFTGMAAAAR